MAEDYYAILDRVDELMTEPILSEDQNEEMFDLVDEATRLDNTDTLPELLSE